MRGETHFAKFSPFGCIVMPWYTNDPPPTPAPHKMSMPLPGMRSMSPVKGGNTAGGAPVITGWGCSHAERWSGDSIRGNVSAFGPVRQRMPRSRTTVSTPARPRCNAAIAPPNPLPITTARRRSSVTGRGWAPAGAEIAAAVVATVAAAAPPRNARRDTRVVVEFESAITSAPLPGCSGDGSGVAGPAGPDSRVDTCPVRCLSDKSQFRAAARRVGRPARRACGAGT